MSKEWVSIPTSLTTVASHARQTTLPTFSPTICSCSCSKALRSAHSQKEQNATTQMQKPYEESIPDSSPASSAVPPPALQTCSHHPQTGCVCRPPFHPPPGRTSPFPPAHSQPDDGTGLVQILGFRTLVFHTCFLISSDVQYPQRTPSLLCRMFIATTTGVSPVCRVDAAQTLYCVTSGYSMDKWHVCLAASKIWMPSHSVRAMLLPYRDPDDGRIWMIDDLGWLLQESKHICKDERAGMAG